MAKKPDGVRVVDRRDFALFMPSTIDDLGLDPFTFRIYARLSRRAGSGEARESVANMAKGCKTSATKCREALRELERLGLIDRTERPGETSLYTLLPTDEWDWTALGKTAGTPTPGVAHPNAERCPTPTRGVAKGNTSEGSTLKDLFDVESVETGPDPVGAVIAALNEATGSAFKPRGAHARHINARLAEGVTLEDLLAIIAHKAQRTEWGNDAMRKYLRPVTLFGHPGKFDGYLGEARRHTARKANDAASAAAQTDEGLQERLGAWRRAFVEEQGRQPNSLELAEARRRCRSAQGTDTSESLEAS